RRGARRHRGAPAPHAPLTLSMPGPGARSPGSGPISPGPSHWAMPDVATMGGGELVALGADLAPATLLDGYRAGVFAMPEAQVLGWWSPNPRGVLWPAQVHVSRSLR